MLRQVPHILLTGSALDLSYHLIKIYFHHYEKNLMYGLVENYRLKEVIYL